MSTYSITTQKSSIQGPSTSDKPHSSTYKPPQTGWLSAIPPSWVPYAELMRLDRPNGFWYFYLPHLFGALHAAYHIHAPLSSLLTTNLILFIGTIVMRGATCTWNDTVDAPFDRLVARTWNRPVARRAVSTLAAHIFTGIQTVISLLILTMLPPVCFVYSVPAIVGWILYPLAKRVTYYPQVVLGFPMAWGVFMGSAAMGTDPLNLSKHSSGLFEVETRGSIYALYAANVVWTLLYETIYSHQDAAEDTKAGVKNIVLLYQGHTRPLLVKLAISQVLMLAAAGYLGEAGPLYWTCTVFGAALTLILILSRVKLDVPGDCAWWFKVGCCAFTGGIMATGLLGDYVMMIFKT